MISAFVVLIHLDWKFTVVSLFLFPVCMVPIVYYGKKVRRQGKLEEERVGSMMGSALGGIGYAEEQFYLFQKEGLRSVSTSLATNVFAGAASCNIAIEYGAQGPNSTNAMSCASGTMAIGEGMRQIRDGHADVMICGASEAPLNQLCFGAFALIRAMSTRNDEPERASRPTSLPNSCGTGKPPR